jgi:hypothetical protein
MERKGKLDYENFSGDLLGEEVRFEISKDAFKGPFICHNKKTVLKEKKLSFNGIDFSYTVWTCKTCNKEYLDSEQGRKFEKFLIVKGFLEDNLVTIERNMNYDGKTFFFRFPKELTKNVQKDSLVDIKLLNPSGKTFLVEIKGAR